MQDDDEFEEYLRGRDRRIRRGSWLALIIGLFFGVALIAVKGDVSTLVFRSAMLLVFLLVVSGATLLRYTPRRR